MMMYIYKTLWGIWFTLSFIMIMGTFVFIHSSHSLIVPLNLSPNKTVEIKLSHFLPYRLNAYLMLSKNKGQERKELGEYRPRDNHQKRGRLEFENPGDTITLSIQSGKTELVYKALPARSHSSRNMYRSLIPYHNDGNPNEFILPPVQASDHIMISWRKTIRFKVLDVGEHHMGEDISLIITPPITFKHIASNYVFFRWFIFWPFYAFLLFCSAMILLVLYHFVYP
ncbi:MAG: hypothetical protein KKD44_17960 [Proteobacteria bacterium]|nr:hypothetical protein [Pseudomonadota bacterium]